LDNLDALKPSRIERQRKHLRHTRRERRTAARHHDLLRGRVCAFFFLPLAVIAVILLVIAAP
jgi:hypothetical protein